MYLQFCRLALWSQWSLEWIPAYSIYSILAAGGLHHPAKPIVVVIWFQESDRPARKCSDSWNVSMTHNTYIFIHVGKPGLPCFFIKLQLRKSIKWGLRRHERENVIRWYQRFFSRRSISSPQKREKKNPLAPRVNESFITNKYFFWAWYSGLKNNRDEI